MQDMTMHRTLAAGFAVAALAAAGCGTNSGNIAAPSTPTQTVTQTVTVSKAAPAPVVRAPRPVTPTYTSFSGSYISVDYPDSWNVDSSEAAKGGYLDTTIRDQTNPALMLRVDLTPSSSAGDLAATAQQVEQSLVSQAGYRVFRYRPSSYQGLASVDWEFLVSEHGVLLHKQDTFFVDASGDQIAILTEAPADIYPSWRSAFAHIRSSFITAGAASVTPPAASPVSFCDTHACIDNFDAGGGYIVQCDDGMWSHSGGLSGACSYHGGESGNVYSGSSGSSLGSSGSSSGGDLGPGNGSTVTCADGSISHSGGIQGACSHHGGVG